MRRVFDFFITILLIISSSVAFAERFSVSSDTANIRSGPGTNHDILWKVEKYHPIIILKKTDTWYHFRDFESDEGWVHKSLVNKTPTVITKSETSNIRSGPGTKHKIIETVDKGIPFKILEKKGKWIHIQHADGDTGWIHNSLVW
ncbi:MAG: SH3 domain-containing protein [Deltaproteobacteria bacterium]|nr:SH3 domain-containing protein [Deltaproteobacteria bacterium]